MSKIKCEVLLLFFKGADKALRTLLESEKTVIFLKGDSSAMMSAERIAIASQEKMDVLLDVRN